MNTWICRRLFIVFGFVSLLSACSQERAAFSFLGDGGDEGSVHQQKRIPLTALKSAEMMRGGVTFVPPQGYCIDKKSLTQSFALISRCDTLGARDVGSGNALGLVTASIVPFEGDADLPALLARSIPPGAEVLERSNTASMSMVRISGASVDGLGDSYWTGLAQIGPGLARVSLYAANDAALNEAARSRLISGFVAHSTRATEAKIVAGKTPTGSKSPLKPLKTLLGGLFQ